MSGAAQPVEPGVARPHRLRIHLLGGFCVEREGGGSVAEHWRRTGARTLVKLLAVTPGGRLHRDQAMEALWPDMPYEAALRSLRVTMHAARHALEPELAPRSPSAYLHTEGELICLDRDLILIDVDEVTAAAAHALATGDRAALVSGLTALSRELLPEDRYASWAEERRRQLVALRSRIVPALAAVLAQAGETDQAVEVLRAELERVPAAEELHLLLARVLLDAGRPRQAVRQYHAARDVLAEELGVPPAAEFQALLREALDALTSPRTGADRTAMPLPPVLRHPHDQPLIGRARPLALLIAHATDVAGGHVRQGDAPLALVAGEAGIGKTRLVVEVARQAAMAGTQVLWGTCHTAEGQTPYGVFVDALDSYLAACPAVERATVAAEHPGLAAVLTTLGEAPTRAGSPEEEQARFFRSVSALLTDLAAARPLLLVLDDLHAADPASLRLLHHLIRTAQSRRWRFIATVRGDELPAGDPRRLILDTFAEQGLAVEVELLRLSRADCARLVGIPPQRARRIYELSRGNPLFALELASAGEVRGVPDGVRRLVSGRLSQLPDEARAVLGALAVAGGGAISVAELEAVAVAGLHPPLGGPAVAAALDTAVTAGFIVERTVTARGCPVTGYAFRHPLVELACAEGVGVASRRQLHRAYAETVLVQRPDAVEAAAFHLSRADDPRAAHWLRRAAERAASLFANDSACAYYADLVARLEPDDPAAAAAARLDWGTVLRRSARYQEAEEVLRAALTSYRQSADTRSVVRAAIALAEVLGRALRPQDGLAELESVRHLLDDRPVPGDEGTTDRVDLELTVGTMHFGSGQYADALAALTRAEHAARQLDEAATLPQLTRIECVRAACLLVTGELGAAPEACEQALRLAERCDDISLLARALSIMGELARETGRLDVARDCARRAVAAARRMGDPAVLAIDQSNLAAIELLRGEHRRAAALATSAVRLARSLGRSWALPPALANLTEILLRTGRTGEARAALADCEQAARNSDDPQVLDRVRVLAAELAAEPAAASGTGG
ncbi:AAA family ATPase [Micromonospora sp. DR5-3]|uniref:ATP-binding protein n=1 Tax=unclassified Micromonospora TaxID=2617518 RepID=UPI0011D493D3|nr:MULTISPECIES: AAA family ATPase [unclassified Micromonospora]MCW3818970.1 AAA family ATPase [Micromonospora sp. DR5-3]TYC19645.1 AAA family ATPase [Micromonospora sp. MP36]